MILDEKQIRAITRGALDIDFCDGVAHFYRFTRHQMSFYEKNNPGFYTKSKATSGVHFDFVTDSSVFGFDFEVAVGSSRSFYFFDIYVDGVMRDHLGEENMWIKKGHIEVKLPEGEHRVTVWLPNLAIATVSNVTLDDGATISKLPASKKMICWGDSITQGYDATFPSLAYTNRLAAHFDANMINQAIGGEKFVPAILDEDMSFKPDIITIAYGTNDWSGLPREQFFSGCDGFLEGVSRMYPDAEIFVLTPIWRADNRRITKFGEFGEAVKYIADKARSLGLHVIDGDPLTPHYFAFYSDLRLHPNDLGYGEYSRNLIAKMEKILG